MKALLTIDQLSCGACAQAIKSRLEQEAAIQAVNVLPQFGKVRVLFDEEGIALETIQRIMEDIGYPVKKQQMN